MSTDGSLFDQRGGKQIHELPLINIPDNGINILCSYNQVTYALKLGTIRALISKEGIGLPLADNTPDLEKPISNPVRQELDLKAPLGHGHYINQIIGLEDVLNLKADAGHLHSADSIVGLQEMIGEDSVVLLEVDW